MPVFYTLCNGNPDALCLYTDVWFSSIHWAMEILMHFAYTLMYACLLYIVQWQSRYTLPIRWCMLAFYRPCNKKHIALCLYACVCLSSIHCAMAILIHFAYTLMDGFLLYIGQWKYLCTVPIRWCMLAFYTLCNVNPYTVCLYTDVCFSSIHFAKEIQMLFAYTLVYACLLYIVQ